MTHRLTASVDHTAQHRSTGALIGSAVGDALGAPFEFKPAGRYAARFPQPVIGGTGEMVGGGGFGWAPGEFTDDTQMALALAESLVAGGRVDPDDLWARWTTWASYATDVGINTRAALAHPSWSGAAAAAHASLGKSASNGALMRVTPLAVFFAGQRGDDITRRTMQAAVAQAALTHHDLAAGWGAATGAELTRRAIQGADPVLEIPSVLAHVPADVRERFATMLAPDWQPNQSGDPSNGSVWTCLAQAVWAVRHHASFHDAVVAAIDLGGDTDTVACVAGALAGARAGIQAIPSRWTTYLHGHLQTPTGPARYDNASLQALARRLTGKDEPAPESEERSIQPRQLMPGVWATSFPGAREFGADGRFAVLSLCRVGGAFARVPVRREVYLVDKEGDKNPALATALDDAVDTIAAWRSEGRDVLVHCHGGRSRTALVIKAWAMLEHGWTEAQAHEWMTANWPHYDPWNRTFREELRQRDSVST